MEALSTEERLATLTAAWPEWEFWIIRAWDGILWCARPRADHTVVLNADSAARLATHVASWPHALVAEDRAEMRAALGWRQSSAEGSASPEAGR